MERSLAQSTVGVTLKPPIAANVQNPAAPGSSFHLDFAVETDDAGLRRLLRETPMPGSIQITLEREPGYFNAMKTEGGCHYTFCARDRATGELFAMGCRTVRELYVNGRPQRVGYLSQLRIAPSHRHLTRSLLVRGFGLLNKTRSNDEASFDITTIVAGNENARRILEHGLPYLPQYTAVERILTVLLPTKGRRNIRDWKVSKNGTPNNRIAYPLQFAPVQPLPGPIWDQRTFKQIVIRGYAAWLHRCRRLMRLPPVGAVLPAIYLTRIPPDLNHLDAMRRMARAMGGRWLTFALAARNPWVNVLRRHYRPRIYESTLYAVHHPDKPAQLDGRCAHVEAALL